MDSPELPGVKLRGRPAPVSTARSTSPTFFNEGSPGATPAPSPPGSPGPSPRGSRPTSPRAVPMSPSHRWRRAVAKVCAQQAVLHALAPEPWWRELRPYASLLMSGLAFSPISQAILITAVRATCQPGYRATLLPARQVDWWWPWPWWSNLLSVCGRLLRADTARVYLRSSALFALHDIVTRGRTLYVEQATEVGAMRPAQPLWRCLLLEALCGAIGAQLSLAYMRSTLGATGRASWRYLGIGTLAGLSRGLVTSFGGRRPALQSACGWAEFLLEVLGEQQGACLLGCRVPVARYVGAVFWGITNFLPWGLLILPCNKLVAHFLGEDPIVQQKAVLERVVRELQQSEHGRSELASAGRRAAEFIGSVELGSLWRRVRLTRGDRQLIRQATLVSREATQRHLDDILWQLAALRMSDLSELYAEDGAEPNGNPSATLLENAMAPIHVRRHDMVRSALTQIADRPLPLLLLGVTAQAIPSLQEGNTAYMLGLRVQFVGEDAVDMGGVRKDFMDCFAAALTRAEPAAPLTLRQPLQLLGLGADSTWRPVPCDEQGRGYLWALGRLLALALVYRSPCPIALSLLVFKCILGTALRPGDVKQLDPDFWNHRIKPLLQPKGVELRQAQLQEWGMDPLTFVSADGERELKEGGAELLVTDENGAEYCQLLCEDFLIGPVRAEIGCLVMGFHEVVPKNLLENLDAEQLRMLVCGVAEIDVDEWERHAQADGPAHIVGWFFDWLRKRPQEARSKMLAFATGSSVLPAGWEGLKDQQGRPLPFRVSVQGEPGSLPSAHTCANLLVLPPVASRAALEQRLDRVLEFAGREMLLL